MPEVSVTQDSWGEGGSEGGKGVCGQPAWAPANERASGVRGEG